jgi:hypothetical protein
VEWPLAYWGRLQAFGCSYESGTLASGALYSLDVPRSTDIEAIDSITQEGQRNEIWDSEEGRVAHRIRGRNVNPILPDPAARSCRRSDRIGKNRDHGDL